MNPQTRRPPFVTPVEGWRRTTYAHERSRNTPAPKHARQNKENGVPEDTQAFDYRRETLLTAIERTREIISDKYNSHYATITNLRSLIKYGSGYRTVKINAYQDEQHPINLPAIVRTSIAVAANNTRLIEYYDPKTSRIREAKPSTVLKFINRISAAEIPDEAIQTIATVLGEQLPTRYGYEFELISGQAIIDLYGRTPYTCMTSSASLKFYANNEPNIQAVRITKDGFTIGRAILWNLTDDRKYLDRIYPASGPHVDLLNKYAKENEWISRQSTSAEIPARTIERLEKANLITVALNAPDPQDNSAHSMGAFPYQDSFKWMKHSPDLTQAMLRFSPRAGWLRIGYTTQYRNHFYCPLLRGWVNEEAVVNARVLDENLNFRAETRFSRDILRRTHTLIRWPKEPGVRLQQTRAYAPNEYLDSIVLDQITGSHFLKQHAVTTPDGQYIFTEDALHMHDDTYLRSSEHLRNVAMLPNGRFILRDNATYNAEAREWQPKGNHE